MDIPQMTMKILPTASALLLDKSSEVRSQAFVLIDACLEILKAHHNAMSKAASNERPDGATTSAGGSGGSVKAGESGGEGAAGGEGGVGWSSWSMLQGLSKTIESATISATSGTAAANSGSGMPAGSSSKESSGDLKMTQNRQSSGSFASTGSGGTISKNSSLTQVHHEPRASYKNDDSFNDDFNAGNSHNNANDDWGDDSFSTSNHNNNSAANKWDNDDIQFDDDIADAAPASPAVAVKKISSSGGGMKLPGASTSVSKASAAVSEEADGGLGGSKSAKKNKVLVKKLDVSKDNWDDF